MGIPPVEVDIETSKKAQDGLEKIIIAASAGTRRRLSGDDLNECGENIYKAPDNVEQVTSDMAI